MDVFRSYSLMLNNIFVHIILYTGGGCYLKVVMFKISRMSKKPARFALNFFKFS